VPRDVAKPSGFLGAAANASERTSGASERRERRSSLPELARRMLDGQLETRCHASQPCAARGEATQALLDILDLPN
jgi:hypothetical protein